jgi:hypothetical protein
VDRGRVLYGLVSKFAQLIRLARQVAIFGFFQALLERGAYRGGDLVDVLAPEPATIAAPGNGAFMPLLVRGPGSSVEGAKPPGQGEQARRDAPQRAAGPATWRCEYDASEANDDAERG